MEFVQKNVFGVLMIMGTIIFVAVYYVLNQSENSALLVLSSVLSWIYLAFAGVYILWLASKTLEKVSKKE